MAQYGDYTTVMIEVGQDTARRLSETGCVAARGQGIAEDDPRFAAYVAGHRSGLLGSAYLATGGSAWSGDLSLLADRQHTVTVAVSMPTHVADYLKQTAAGLAANGHPADDDALVAAVEAHTAALIESSFSDCWQRWQAAGESQLAS